MRDRPRADDLGEPRPDEPRREQACDATAVYDLPHSSPRHDVHVYGRGGAQSGVTSANTASTANGLQRWAETLNYVTYYPYESLFH
jgi:hypothetical protein